MDKHWSRVEYLHETHRNPNIILKGTHSYYSDAWSGCFEEAVVRYLYGDAYSVSHYESRWEPDKLRIGDYVCIGAEAVILMGGNNTHRMDWFCCRKLRIARRHRDRRRRLDRYARNADAGGEDRRRGCDRRRSDRDARCGAVLRGRRESGAPDPAAFSGGA